MHEIIKCEVEQVDKTYFIRMTVLIKNVGIVYGRMDYEDLRRDFNINSSNNKSFLYIKYNNYAEAQKFIDEQLTPIIILNKLGGVK